jgi:hypothetical protein
MFTSVRKPEGVIELPAGRVISSPHFKKGSLGDVIGLKSIAIISSLSLNVIWGSPKGIFEKKIICGKK